MQIILRQMEVSDLDDIMEIEKESFSTPWSREAFKMEVEENLLAVYIVAQIDDKVVGYGGLWTIMDEGHITNIAVREAFRGQGIGDAIVMGLVQYCRSNGIPNMTLEVRKSNIVAQNLYKKYGFIDCGIRPNYYTDGNEDAVIMWKSFNEGDEVC